MKPGATTIFSYSIGDVIAITSGALQRTRLQRARIAHQNSDYKRLFQNAESRSAMPYVVGVYQKNTPARAETPEEKRKLEGLLARMNDMLDADIQKHWNIRDPLHRDLIHIGYDQNTLTREQINACVVDPLKRVVVSPLDRLPDFSQ